MAERCARPFEGLPASSTKAAITALEIKVGYVLSAKQREAVFRSVSTPFSVLCGGAGTGKTKRLPLRGSCARWRPERNCHAAAILASYSCSRSAAFSSSSLAPASNLPTHIRISCREMSCRWDSRCNVFPAMTSFVTSRLNAALCDRCFVMASILRNTSKGAMSIVETAYPKGRTPVTWKIFNAV